MHALLAFHVTLALGVTILLGVQSVRLAQFRAGRGDDTGQLGRLIIVVPVLTLVVVVTGGMLLGTGSPGGPWVAAGAVSSLVLIASAVWTLLVVRSRRPLDGARRARIAATQWGAPAFTLAATFLMAARPDGIVAVVPPLVALLVTGWAYFTGARGAVSAARTG